MAGTYLVTGAAGRIGYQTCIELLKSGNTVIFSDLSQTHLDSLLEELPSGYSHHAYAFAADITNPDDVDKLISTSNSITGNLHGIAHCAYPRHSSPLLDFDKLDYRSLCTDLSLQLASAIYLSRKAVELFIGQGFGNLVHISSIQGICAPKFDHYLDTDMSSSIGYSAIKAGIIGCTKWLAKYTANKNIRVNCVSPGGIEDNQPQVFKDRYRNSCTNLGLLAPIHVATTIAFLLSDSSFAINGQNLVVDDGWSL